MAGMKRLLITGGSGYLGGRLAALAGESWNVGYTWFRHPVVIPSAWGMPLDMLDKNHVLRLFQDFRPDAVIHTAYSHDNLATMTDGVKHIVQASAAVGARLLHLSTDAVFDGERGGYRENETPRPIHPYGKAKAEAERIVCDGASSKRDAVIIRTSLIWGLNPLDPRTLHLKNQLESKSKPVLFTDEYRCPVLVDELAAAILEILNSDFRGIIHVAGPERLSRCEFGRKLARHLGLNPEAITPGLSRESGLLRPRDCSLDASLARRLLRTKINSASQLLDRDNRM